MASIILSFVGTQDPYSVGGASPVENRTNEEGSIVTLVKHLADQNKDITHIFLSTFWSKVRKFDDGNLYQQLARDNISNDGWVYVKAMSKIIEYTDRYTSLLQVSSKLQTYCQDRNNYIHKLEGISQLDQSDVILNDLRNMLKQLTKVPDLNTFDRLNQDILNQLQIDR